jgi:hypothetical protein
MAGDGFKNLREIKNWLDKVMYQAKDLFKYPCECDYPDDGGTLSPDRMTHSIKVTFRVGSFSKEIFFMEHVVNNTLMLSVYVDSKEVFTIKDGAKLGRYCTHLLLRVLMGG